MIIWRGAGFAALLAVIIGCFNVAAPSWGRRSSVQVADWLPYTAGIAAFALLGWFGGRHLNRGAPSWREARHSLYMVPLEYWAVALALSQVVFVARLYVG